MTIHFSPVIVVQSRDIGHGFAAKSLELHDLGDVASPIEAFYDFRVNGHPFGPHPHAGFSAVTYVFEDSLGSLRNRDSLGNDIVVRPGGVVWKQAGNGVTHEQLPADAGRELHALHVFVNFSANNKVAAPQVLRLDRKLVPVWRSDRGDRVRVVVGSFEGVSSPLVPTEPFNLLDVHLHRESSFDLPEGDNALVYVREGIVVIHGEREQRTLGKEQALALQGSGARVIVKASTHAQLLLLSSAEIREPAVGEDAWIRDDGPWIDAALARGRAGEMGRLQPVSIRTRHEAPMVTAALSSNLAIHRTALS